MFMFSKIHAMLLLLPSQILPLLTSVYGAATHESAAQDPIITRRTQTGCFMINFIVT